ncbi:hypothetical protein FD754_012113 [Muntiacus muntjak]|uniref:Uncharacterized protein n=1 Tax=Muntiacus muntjak TaxID=9888 RepID=A0A5N3VGG1_MUNMU|nr:hypothetical protein FD754_012113 [Muntiacus muntjak]
MMLIPISHQPLPLSLFYHSVSSLYIAFFCPCDLVSQGYSFLPVQLLAAGMKEVTRTWKIVGGVTHANSYYKNGWIVMIAIGWARGAGGSIITNFEQLLKGCWKPEAEEWLKMSYRMLFGWQQQFLPCEKKSETKSSFNGTGSSTSKPVANASEKVKKKHSKKTE